MAWSTPKTDWVSADVIGNTDLNRIEGNIAEVANVSGNDAQLAQNATGTLDIGETATTVNLGEGATTVNLGDSSVDINTLGNSIFSGSLSHTDIRGSHTSAIDVTTDFVIPAGLWYCMIYSIVNSALIEVKDNADTWRTVLNTVTNNQTYSMTILSDGTNARIRSNGGRYAYFLTGVVS